MRRWIIEFTSDAEKDIAVLDIRVRRRIIDKIEWLVGNFEAIVPQTLGGEFADFYKLRTGDWRIKYTVNWAAHIIVICYIDRRDKAYKKKKP